MKELNETQLRNIVGGQSNTGFWLLIGSGIVFLIGIIDGIVRPLKCN